MTSPLHHRPGLRDRAKMRDPGYMLILPVAMPRSIG
jgi:hypothetical protein